MDRSKLGTKKGTKYNNHKHNIVVLYQKLKSTMKIQINKIIMNLNN